MTDRPVVLVTGASRGIGAAAARRLLARGCQVAIVARSRKDLAAFAAETAGTEMLLPLTGDVAREPDCRRVLADTVARFGRLDALINNAGILGPVARLADADPGEWQYNLAVNLLGAPSMDLAGFQQLRNSPRVILGTSIKVRLGDNDSFGTDDSGEANRRASGFVLDSMGGQRGRLRTGVFDRVGLGVHGGAQHLRGDSDRPTHH